MIAQTPQPPYYAVIFTSLSSEDTEGYVEMGDLLESLAEKQDGFLGIESARSGIGITVSYWRDLESIRQWKLQVDHLAAQREGRERWYQAYKTRISKVERDYGFESPKQ